jgi:hypothetical protein
MFLAGEFPHKIEAVFCWIRGGFYGFVLWEVEMLCVRVMGVTLVARRAPIAIDLQFSVTTAPCRAYNN